MNDQVDLLIRDKKILEELKQAAANSNLKLNEASDLSEQSKTHSLIFDLDVFLENTHQLKNLDMKYVYLISPKSDEENMALISQFGLQHVVGFNEGIFGKEIISHLEKAVTGKLWGFKPYMDVDADTRILSLSDSKYTHEMIHEALGHFDFEEYFSSPIEYIKVMANELISNSLYKGPNKKRHEHGLESVERKSPVFLKGSELVQVTLGMDSKSVALSVQDSFGGLSYEILTDSLKRSFIEKTAMDKKDGAGLGLYLTFLHSNQFIVNYRENFRTEVICIIEKNKRYKSYKQRIRSFHFFQEVSSEKINDK